MREAVLASPASGIDGWDIARNERLRNRDLDEQEHEKRGQEAWTQPGAWSHPPVPRLYRLKRRRFALGQPGGGQSPVCSRYFLLAS